VSLFLMHYDRCATATGFSFLTMVAYADRSSFGRRLKPRSKLHWSSSRRLDGKAFKTVAQSSPRIDPWLVAAGSNEGPDCALNFLPTVHSPTYGSSAMIALVYGVSSKGA